MVRDTKHPDKCKMSMKLLKRNKTMYDPIETIEYRDCIIKLYPETEPIDPREDDNLGTMICFHCDHCLGDKHDFTPESLNEYIKRPDVIALPLYLLDHSGLWIKTSRQVVSRANAFSWDPGGWDTSFIGYIVIDYEKIRKEYLIKNVTKKVRERVIDYLFNEVNTYNNYLTGNVVWYNTETRTGEPISSCGNFFADEHDKFDYVIQDAKENIDWYIEQSIKKHCAQVKTWIQNRVPLEKRLPLVIG